MSSTEQEKALLLQEQLTTAEGATRVDLLIELAHASWYIDPRQTESAALEAHHLAVELGLQRKSAEALNHLGIAMYMLQQYDDGEDYLNQAIAEAREAKYNRVVINAYSNLGAIYSVRGQYSEALTVMYHALTWIEEHPEEGVDPWPMLNNIACTNNHIGDQDNSLAYHRRALTLAREHADDAQIGTNADQPWHDAQAARTNGYCASHVSRNPGTRTEGASWTTDCTCVFRIG